MYISRMPVLNIEEKEIPYEVRRSLKARRGRIVVSLGKVEIVAPRNMSEKKIISFIDEHKGWIKKKYIEIETKAASAIKPLPERFIAGKKIMYLGDHVPIYVSQKNKKTVEYNGWLFIHAPENECRDLVIKWLKQKAREQVEFYVNKHKENFNLHVGEIRIKSQKRRWGSCGRHNSININWQLIFFKPEILEYVVVHELCHIRHKNHSKRFWDFVGEHLPDYSERRKYLRENTVISDF